MLLNNQIIFVKIIVFLFLGIITLKAQKTVIDDPLQGSTKGEKVGGSLTSEGFKPSVGKYHKSGNSEDHILYEVTKQNGGKVIENGYVEFQVKGFRMSDFESTSSSLPSRESGFMVLYDGRGVNEPLKYDPDSKHNYFYWVIHYRSEKYNSSAGNKWKTVINCAEPISLRTNSSKAVFTDATSNNGLVDAKDGKINLLDRDWTVEPNGIKTSWDPDKWYTIKVQWDNEKREFKVFRDEQLVWFNELEEGRSWKSYDNSTNPAPYPWRPLDLKIWLGSGTGRYDNDMKNILYRNFKVVDEGGTSCSGDPTPPPIVEEVDDAVVQIDFGGDSTAEGWNLVDNTIQEGGDLTLWDSAGELSGMTFSTVTRWNGINSSGTPDGAGLLPPSVTADSIYGTDQEWGGSIDPNPAFSISGMDTGSVYRFTVYASRMGVSDDRSTLYTVTGDNTVTGILNPANNAQNVLILDGIVADAEGKVVLDFIRAAANTNGYGFIYIGALIIEKNTSDPVKPDPLPWDDADACDLVVSPWFGAFEMAESSWINHCELIWLYTGEITDTSSMWMYSLYLESWAWSSEDTFPLLYNAATASWIYYFQIPDIGVWEYDLSIGEWVFQQ